MRPTPLTAARRPADVALPAQLWESLTPESRRRVVHLLAQLACTLATSAVAPAPMEPAHVPPAHLGQDPA